MAEGQPLKFPIEVQSNIFDAEKVVNEKSILGKKNISNIRSTLLSEDSFRIKKTLDDLSFTVGTLISPNLENLNDVFFKYNDIDSYNKKCEREGRKNDCVTKRGIQEIVEDFKLNQGKESDIIFVENVLKLSFFFNKLTKFYSQNRNDLVTDDQKKYLDKGKEWSYSVKDQLLSTLSYLLITNNYDDVKNWGFKKDPTNNTGQNDYILRVDLSGHQPFSFHVTPEKILPKSVSHQIRNGQIYEYLFDNNEKNHTGHRLTDQEIKLLKSRKKQIVGEKNQNISPVIEVDKNFITADLEKKEVN